MDEVRVAEEGEEEKKIDIVHFDVIERGQKVMDWKVDISVKKRTIKQTVKFKIDSGADVSVVPPSLIQKLSSDKNDLQEVKDKLFAANGSSLRCLGMLKVTMEWQERTVEENIYVVEGLTQPLLGRPTIEKLQILQINAVICCKGEIPSYLREFTSTFTGLGKMVGPPFKIQLHEGATPWAITAPRRIPYGLMDKVKAELQRMENLGVIQKVEEPTDWCHPIVIVFKDNGEIRLCIDLTKLNPHIKREYRILDSVEDCLARIGRAKYFTKLDANSGYWQVPSDSESQKLTTFITPFGRYCCLRSRFGINSLPEHFSGRMDGIIEGCEGVVKVMDDLLISGEDVDSLRRRTKKLVQRLAENGVTLNRQKCQFEQREIKFAGYIVDQEGVKADPEKVTAVAKFKSPINLTELKRFMGLVNQLAPFSDRIASLATPVRDLLSTSNHWLWTKQHEKAFQEIKEELVSTPVLGRYEVNRATKIATDCSRNIGLSFILSQQHGQVWKPVMYGSRFLTPAEKNYAMVELECSAVVWACDRLRLYLVGLPHFVVETDHKPLVPILNVKCIDQLSPRLQRLRMKLMAYNFTAVWIPGKQHYAADALSRAPVREAKKEDEVIGKEVEFYVNSIVQASLSCVDGQQEEMEAWMEKEEEMKTIKKYVMEGWPLSIEGSEEIKEFWKVREDLTLAGKLLLKNDRVVIPKGLRSRWLYQLHKDTKGWRK